MADQSLEADVGSEPYFFQTLLWGVKRAPSVLHLLPRKALREEGQATENLLAAVELLHVRGCYHGDALVVLDAEVVHAETAAPCDTQHKGRGTLCSIHTLN